jgi:CheY-like chemotaxis protein
MMRVLVVDDDGRVREVFLEILRGAGHEVQSAMDGAEGLRVFTEWRPDVVLVDMFMPVMDGLELIRALRGLSTSVGIVAMSGVWQRSGVMDQALALGATQALLKPVSIDVLLQTIDAVGRKSREPDTPPG